MRQRRRRGRAGPPPRSRARPAPREVCALQRLHAPGAPGAHHPRPPDSSGCMLDRVGVSRAAERHAPRPPVPRPHAHRARAGVPRDRSIDRAPLPGSSGELTTPGTCLRSGRSIVLAALAMRDKAHRCALRAAISCDFRILIVRRSPIDARRHGCLAMSSGTRQPIMAAVMMRATIDRRRRAIALGAVPCFLRRVSTENPKKNDGQLLVRRF